MLRNWLPALAHFANRFATQKQRLARSCRRVPFLLELEDRVNPSTLIPVTNYSDLVFDPGRDILYITTSAGQVQRWDVATQQQLSPWNVGTSLLGADITPDDSSLYVAEKTSSDSVGLFYQVNLNSGAVTDLPYNLASTDGGSYDIAIAANGKALVTTYLATGNADTPLQQLDTATNTYSFRNDAPGAGGNGLVSDDTSINRSADGSVLLITEGLDPNGRFFLYNSSTDTFSSPAQSIQVQENTSPVVNRNGTLFAMEMFYGASVFDSKFNTVHDIAGLRGGLAFDPSQDILYGVDLSNNLIYAYDTNTWDVKYTLPLDETYSGSPDFGTGNLVVSPDDKYLFMTTPSGVREYALPQATGVASSLTVTGFPQFIANGIAGTVTVTAHDPAGNVVTNYTGTVHFSSTSAGILPPDYTFTPADNGSHTFNVTLTTTGTQALTVTDQADNLSANESGIVVHDFGTDYIPISNYHDLVFDPTRYLLYITTDDGLLQIYDPTTETLLAPIPVGVDLEGADITPGGSSLYVADAYRGATQDVVYDVNLNTDAVTKVTYPVTSNGEQGAYDVSFAANGLGFVTLQGAYTVPLLQLDPATNTLSERTDAPGMYGAGIVPTATMIAHSPDRTLLVMSETDSVEPDASDAQMMVYSSTTNSFLSTMEPFYGPLGRPAIDRADSMIAISDGDDGVLSPSLQLLWGEYDIPTHPDGSSDDPNTSPYSDFSGDWLFDPNNDILFICYTERFTGADVTAVTAFDTNNWNVLFQVPIDQTMAGDGYGPPKDFSTYMMAMASDSYELFYGTPTQINILYLYAILNVTGFPSPVTAGTQGQVTVTADNLDGTVDTGYFGTIHFSSTDQQAGLPADYTFTAADQGVHTFPVTLCTAGVQSITVTDFRHVLTGSQTGIVVLPAAPDHLDFSVEPSNNTAGHLFNPVVQVSEVDKYDNVETSDSSTQITIAFGNNPGDGSLNGTTTLTVQGGVANFSDLAVDIAGTGYTLTATTTGLPDATSNPFNITPGPASYLAFGAEPRNGVAGAALSPAVTVEEFDVYGNLETGDNSTQVTLSVASGPGTFTSSSTTTVTVSGGIATFNNLVLDTAGNYTLAENATGNLTGANSSGFTINFAAPDHIGFAVQPRNTSAGAAIAPPVKVAVYDQYDNIVTTDDIDHITLTVASGPGGFDPESTTTATVSGGIATFNNLILDTAGAYTLGEQTAGVLTGPDSNGFTVNSAGPDHLGFSGQPSNTSADAAISPAVQVSVLDKYLNPVTADNSDQVTLTVASGPGNFASGSTTTVAVTAGVATFSNLIFHTGGSYTLGESGTGGLTGPNSSSFTVSPPVPAYLSFTVQPGTSTAGNPINPAVQVTIFDKFGGVVSDDNSDQVTLSVASGTGGFTSGSTTTVTVSGGVATFTNLVLDTAGTYTLAESGTIGLSGPNSSSFTVNAAAPNHLRFTAEPTSTTAGVAMSPQVEVGVVDLYGNVVTTDNSDQVTLSIVAGPGGFTSGSTTTATVSAGAATFSNLILDSAGTYVLGESATGGVTGPNSTSFTVIPSAPSQLAFTVQPSNTTAGVAISPPLQVSIEDAYGNLVADDNSDQITLSIVAGPGGFTSGSTTTATAAAGVVTFSNLILDTAGTYGLAQRGTGGLAGANSTSFIVNPAADDHMSFLVQPGNTTAGAAINPPVKVAIFDRFGNLETNDNSDLVTLSVASGPGPFDSKSTTQVAVIGGVAVFSDLILDTVGTYTLGEATNHGLSGPNSNSFTITVGAPAQLAFSVQPSNTQAGVAISPAVKATVFDQYGNVETSDNSDEVTLSIASGPGGFDFSSSITEVASAGVATFSDLILDTVGSYTLGEKATGGLTGPSSSSFSVSEGAGTQLVFSVQPSNTIAGVAISPAVQVEITDQFGNLLTADNSDQVTLAVASGPGSFDSSSTTTMTVSGGVATFGNLVLDTAGSYTLSENGTSGLTGADSGSFTVSPAAADHLGFGVQPSNTSAGSAINPAVTVNVFDRFGNLETTDGTDQVTLTVASGSGGFDADSTTTMAVTGGVATFSNVILDTAGNYTLGESAQGGLTGPDSSMFTVSPAAADHLAFNVQPSTATAGVAVSPAVVVGVFDKYDNLLTSDNSDQVTLSVAGGPAGFAAGSKATATVSGGIATFSSLILDTAGSYVLAENHSGGITGLNSHSFTVNPAAADHLAFSVQPSNTAAGTVITPTVQVQVFDEFDNLLTNDNSDQVTVSIASGPGVFTPNSTPTVTFINGVATFTNLILDTAGNYLLADSMAGGVRGANSNQFSIAPGASDHLGFSVQPSDTSAGAAISPAVQVKVLDLYGNVVTGDNSDRVTLIVASGPAGFAAGSTATVTVSGGGATFSSLIIDTAGSYTLSEVATGGLSGPNSSSFNVSTLTTPVHLAFSAQPTDTLAGTRIVPAVQVEVLDQYGNLITSDNSDQVTVSVASGPGGFASGSTTTVTVNGGVATFNNLLLDTAGSYTLAQSGPGGATGADSSSFAVIADPVPNHLGFAVEPGNAAAGTAIAPAAQVAVLDQYGNLLTADNSDQVTLSIGAGPGGFDAGSTTTLTVNGGLATFSNLMLDTEGTYSLSESATGGLAGPDSSSFTISAAAANHVKFSTQPSDTTAGAAINPAVQVQLFDRFGNLLSGDNSDQVSIALAGGGSLGGTTTVTVANGVATFADLTIDEAGSYILTASSSGENANSTPFNVTAGTATHLVIASQPTSVTAGDTFTIVVNAEDNYGNVDPTFPSDVTVSLASNPGSSVLGGTLSVPFTGGVATFSDLTLTIAGPGYPLEFVAPGLPPLTTPPLSVSPAPATQLVLLSPLAGLLTANTGFSMQLAAEDPFGNVDPNFAGTASVVLVSDPAGGTLGGQLTATAQAGLISFAGLTLSQGGPYGLNFSSGTLTPVGPSVTALAFQHALPAVKEDTVNPAGMKVSALFLSNYHDTDFNSKPGIAVTATGGNGIWQYSSNGRRWLTISNVSATQALLLPATYQVRFVPGMHWTGQASVIFTAWDGSTGKAGGLGSTIPDGGTTAFSLAPAEDNLPVTPINHAPTWLPGSAALTPVLPGNVNLPGDSVSSIFAGNFQDIDAGTLPGVAVVGLTGTNKGAWQYSTNSGSTWNAFGTPSLTAARLLSGNDLIRFVPKATTGLGVVTLQAYAWDQTSGTDGQTVNLKGKGKTGGQTAFSTTRLTAGFAINNASVLSSTLGPPLLNTSEDVPGAAIPVAALLTNESDPDPGARAGVAIVDATGPGTWQYTLNGVNWLSMGAVSEALARLLPISAHLRFLPALHQIGQATLSYRAWDETAGTSGTLFAVNGTGGAYAFSDTEAMATLTVDPVNHAPTWSGIPPQLPAMVPGTSNPAGESIDSLFGGDFHDIDYGTTTGIAIAGLKASSGGSWEYLLDGTSVWQDIGSASASAALLLSGLDEIRFVPNADFTGTASIEAYAWDGTSGSDGGLANLTGPGATGGQSAFSTKALTTSVRVGAAPTLASTTGPTLPAMGAAVSVHTLLAGQGAGLKGVAIVGISGAGMWQYSLDGKHWQSMGAVSETLVRLLPSTAEVRYLPGPHQSGQATLTYRAWNQTAGTAGSLFAVSGTGGATAFSTTEATAKLTAPAVHRAPVWTGSGAALTPVLTNAGNPAGDTVATVFGRYYNVDVSGSTPGIAVTSLTGTKNGLWQYSLDGGTTWLAMGKVSAKAALLLSGSDRVRFRPNAGFAGTVSVQAYAWDGTSGSAGGTATLTGHGKTAGSTAFSTTALTATCLVNTAPVLEA